MIATIARKELRELLRDGRFRLVALVVLGLSLVTAAFGWQSARAVASERASAQAIAASQFSEQDDKNPHVAAHYGLYVFKPSGALAFLDPGVEPYLGVSVKLTAHRQSLLRDAAAADGTAMQRFGRLSVAAVLQLLVPLLLIGLGFGAWTSERERGTLRQLASLGVSPVDLLVGKALALLGAVGATLLPALAVGLIALAFVGGNEPLPPGTLPRLLWLVPVYAAYFAAFTALVLVVSALARSSRSALVTLLGLWVAMALVVPRIAGDVAARLVPLPESGVLAREVQHSLEQGIPGQTPRKERVEAISEALLERHGFKGAEALMDASLLDGLELQAEATYEDEVFDHHFGALYDRIERQDAIAKWLGVASPVIAVRALSMGLAGTDFAHHRAFASAAERHRRVLVTHLNDDFAKNAGAEGWSYRAGKAVWEAVPPFVHTPPSPGWALARQALSAGLLLAWVAVAGLCAWWSARRIRVVDG